MARLDPKAIEVRFTELLREGFNIRATAADEATGNERAKWLAWMMSAVNFLEKVLPATSRHRTEIVRLLPPADGQLSRWTLNNMLGVLASAASEWSAGFLESLENHFMGIAFTDFLHHAAGFNENNQTMEAAVLASAVLEDTVKRLCSKAAIPADGKTLDEMISALKTQSILPKVKAERVRSYAAIRNRAFHADWKALDQRDLRHMIEGLEELIELHFGADDSGRP